MTDTYYVPGDKRAARVSDLFGAIARRYDLVNDLQSLGLHRRWKRRLVDLAQPRPRERALDVCCGTGDIAFELARRGAGVVGVDFSEAMLEVARGKREVRSAQRDVQGAGFGADSSSGSIDFLRGDAQQLPFPPESFDIVTIGYGLRNLADWRVGLSEMCRVARPGGRLLVLDFGKPDNALWRQVYLAYLRWLVPVFGRLFCGDAQTYAYILESLRHYPAQRGVAEQMRASGCDSVRVANLLGGAMSINSGCKRR
jgi:demethylmenaquinone methyltransferase / 2-methoxy-6-polyprenyl-1,4-benzoquinol methylase